MMRLRLLCGVFLAALLVVGSPVRAGDDEDLSAAEQLARAIKLYDAGDYTAAQQALRDIKPEKLTDEAQQVQLQRYVAMVRLAISREAEAKDDFESASAAVQAKDLELAMHLFDRVVKNEFAPADLRSKAKSQFEEISAKLNAPPPTAQAAPPPAKAAPPPAQAAPPPAQAAPPPAKAASPPAQSAAKSAPPPAKGGGSLLDQLSEEYELLWQQAVKTYKETESKVRKAVLKEDFEEAHRLLDFAKQTIELNRRYASPPSVYDDYLTQAAALQRYVEDEERQWQERQVQAKVREIEEREKERVERIGATKRRQIDGLMDQATELRKERRYEDAIQVLDQVLAIDPENDRAAWLKETLGDFAANLRERETTAERDSQFQSLIHESNEAMIPWHENLIYPKNWPEITAKRKGEEQARESELTLAAVEKLRKKAPEIKFETMQFEETINQLRALTGLNIVPNWAALDAAGISKDAEVTLKLKEGVPFEKVLQFILDEVSAGGGEVKLAYTIDEGVVQVSTKEDLNRKTVTKVYNVQDLLITVPTYVARQINLDQAGQNSGQSQYPRGQPIGQGGGGGSSSGSQGMQGGGAGQQPMLTGREIEPIIELIRNTIDPESWREAGGSVGSIQALNQQIIVTQTSSAHSELLDLLKDLRKARALQVAVETRFITITRNWMEQIGVDLDVVLNNGNAGFDRTSVINPATNNPILVPRQFTRNGFTPGAPGGVGIPLPTTPFPQPYGQPGLVPAASDVGPHWGNMTPVPIVNNTMQLAAPTDTNVAGSLGSTANSTPAFQMFGSFLDNIQVDFLLRATQIDRRASDLEAPRLVVNNGGSARIDSILEQDYIAGLIPIVGDNAGMFQPYVDTAVSGRSLWVRPTASNDRRYVNLDVQTFTRIFGGFRTVFFGGSNTVGSGFVELVTQTTQSIVTQVSVPDGGTLLIGGLKLSGERDVDAGVPILSRIPVLKRAFTNTSNVKDDQVLLILIKPTIIIQDEAEKEAFPTLMSER